VINLTKKFYDDMFKGGAAKELVKVLLEKSGYDVYPYGYERTLTELKNKLRDKHTKRSRTVRKIKSSPDFLVYDEKRKDLMLVEVKMRKAPHETKVLIDTPKIAIYKEFWNDSILVVVVPCGNVFYAQKVSELETKGMYDATTDFEKLEDVFTRITTEDLSDYRTKAQKLWEK